MKENGKIKIIITLSMLIIISIGISLIIVVLLDFRIHSDTALFTLSASAQVFAAILVLSLIILYEQKQFFEKMIWETENRIFKYVYTTIGWTYPKWTERIENHIDADIANESFANTYLKIQLQNKLPIIEIQYGSDTKVPLSTFQFMKWDKGYILKDFETRRNLMSALNYENEIKKFEIEIRDKGLEEGTINERVEKFKEDFDKKLDKILLDIVEIVKREKNSTLNQQEYLKGGRNQRNFYRDKYNSIIDVIDSSIVGLIIALSVSLLLLALQKQNYDPFPFIDNENTITIIFVIVIGLISTIWMVLQMYDIAKKHEF